jgi:hypothetical protein
MNAPIRPFRENSPREDSPRQRLREIGQMLHSQGIFTGGPPEYFEMAGRLQLATLLREGLPAVEGWNGCGCHVAILADSLSGSRALLWY